MHIAGVSTVSLARISHQEVETRAAPGYTKIWHTGDTLPGKCLLIVDYKKIIKISYLGLACLQIYAASASLLVQGESIERHLR